MSERRKAKKAEPAKKPFIDERAKGALQIIAAIIITALVLLSGNYIREFSRLGYLGAFIISLLSSATVIIPAPGWALIIAMGE